MAKMMQYNVNGLRQRSVYAMVQQDVPKQGEASLIPTGRFGLTDSISELQPVSCPSADDPSYLICKRGDLLLVEKDSYPPDSDLFTAINQRTKSRGVVYKDKMEFLPTLTEPAEDMLVK